MSGIPEGAKAGVPAEHPASEPIIRRKSLTAYNEAGCSR